METLTQSAAVLIILGIILLAVATIVMPVVVLMIDCRVARIAKSLASMEKMMMSAGKVNNGPVSKPIIRH